MKKVNTTLQIVAMPQSKHKKTNGEHKLNSLDKNSRTFETRFIPRYKKIPPMPAGLPTPTFSESSNKILKERYLLKGGNLEVVESVAERFWHIAYDIASGDFDFSVSPKQVLDTAQDFYSMMVRQEFLPNSPTIMNAGKQNGLQYSACFVLPVGDSLPEIFDSIKFAALIHQTGGGCISSDARVWSTFCGIEPIETLFTRATADGRQGVRQGSGVAYDVSDLHIETVAMNPQTAEVGLKEVSHVWQFDVPADQQILITTYQGAKVQTSLWHPFMVLKGTKLIEIRADQLIKGDIILGPDKADSYWPWQNFRDVGSLKIDEDLGWLIGFTLGDGSFGYARSLRQFRVRWFSGTKDVLKKVQEVLLKQKIKVSIQRDKRGLLSVATLNQRFVHDLLEACGLEKFGPKDNLIRIPELITKSPLSVVKSFLAGLLDSDGYVAPDGSPSYSTVSEAMAQDLAALVSLLGFNPSVKSKEPYGKGKQRVYNVQLCTLPQVNDLASQLKFHLANDMRLSRLKSDCRRQTALPLEFRPWRDLLLNFGLAHTRRNDVGSGPLYKELNNWSAHGRIDRDSILSIADKVQSVDKKTALLLKRITGSGYEIKDVKKAPRSKHFYDLSVADWNTYAAGQSGMVMIHNTGFAFSRLRPAGSIVNTTGGVASGPVSFLRVFNAATESIKQGGTRRGANMGILRVDHPDILEFIRCKAELDDLNRPVFDSIAPLLSDDASRDYVKTLLLDKQMANFNISVAVTNKFMKALEKGEEYDLITPHSGEAVGKLNAKAVFDEIIERAWKTGDPGLIFIDRINHSSANPVPSLEVIESTNPCVTRDTWIHTSEGPKQVYELIGNPFKARINGNDFPSTENGFFETGKKQVYSLQTKEGFNLRLTADHKIKRVTKFSRYLIDSEWIEIRNLQVGDRIVLNNHRTKFEWQGAYSFNDGYLMGLLIGDGTLKNDKAILSVWNPQETGSESVMMEVSSLLKETPNIRLTSWMSIAQRGEYRLSNAYIKHLAKDLGMSKGNKTITSSMEKASSDFNKGLVRGLFDTDGSVQGSQIKGVSIRLAQSNFNLLQTVQRILLRVGIASCIYKNRREAGYKNLPDGKGGLKKYAIKAQHELVISGDNLITFQDLIGFKDSLKTTRLQKLLKNYKRTLNRERFIAVVDKLIIDKEEMVFDAQIMGRNAFDANGIIAHNCGEQPLAPWDACNLGSINLGKFVLADGSDIDWERLGKTTKLAVHFLDNVVQTNPFTLKQIYDEVHKNRRIGLGVMGFADMLFKLKVPYNSNEALELAEKVMKFVTEQGHKMSEELALQRGPFPNWAHSIYADGNPIRNSTVTTIAPTGTISIIGDCSSGIEPVFALAYIHRAKAAGDEYRTLTIANQTFTDIAKREGFHSDDLAAKVLEHGSVMGIDAVPQEWQKVFVTAPEIDPAWHVGMQAAFQKYTDNGVSKTINLPNSATRDDVQTAYLMAWQTGCNGITIYRDGSKSTQVLNVSSSLQSKKEASSAPVAERPMILRGRTYKVSTPVGEAFITINRDEKDQPFEVFVTVGRAGMHTMADAEAMGRLVSLSLRLARGTKETDPKAVAAKIVGQLRGIGGASSVGFGKNRVMSLADAIAKVLAEDLAMSPQVGGMETIPLSLTVDDNNNYELQTMNSKLTNADLCPECGSASFVMEEGCKKCHSCGYSMC